MNPHPSYPKVRPARGFTVIELLIAVVVLGIVSALAFPSFMSSIRKSRRAEAFTALAAVQQKQERWRTEHPKYANSLTGEWPTAGLNLPDTTPGNYYRIAIVSPSDTESATDDRNYEITATAISGSSQMQDGDCVQLGVKMESGNITYGSASATSTLSYAATDKCWGR